MKKICKDCGREFELSPGEIQFYKSKNLELPKRCKECRDKNNRNNRKIHKEQQNAGNTQAAQPVTTNMPKNTQNIIPANTIICQIPRRSRVYTSKNLANENARGYNNKNGKHRISTAIAAILILAASLFGGHFLQNEDTIPNSSSNHTAYTNKQEIVYTFRSDAYLTEHFEKHGEDFDYDSKEEYLAGANRVIASEDALHKTEKEDGDDVYYLETTNEFVIVSTDGYIRTYFRPQDGIAYYNRQ